MVKYDMVQPMNKLEEIVKNATGETRKALEELVHALADSLKKNKMLEQHVEYMKNDARLMKKRLYGASSEKIKTDDIYHQPDVFNEFELCAEAIELNEAPVTEEKTSPKKKHPGRKPLPKHFPRNTIEHDLSDAEKHCICGNEMECIGAQVSEELHYTPAKFTVIEHRCKKYGCPTCNTKNKKDPTVKAQLKTAIKPKSLIPKSFASASLLASIIVSKFCDHLPLYRLESIFKRSSIDLSRQVMSQWVLKVADAAIPLVNLLQEKILEYDVAFADETTLQVLHEADRRAQAKSYMWCFVGGPPDQRSIIYQYHVSRKGDIAVDFFEGYQGALHCDGYAGYNNLIESDAIVGINCLAHVRRKFVEALPNGKEKGVSGYVVKVIRELYNIEAHLKATNASTDTIKAVRQEKAKTILDNLKTYLNEKECAVPPQSPVGKAIQYALRRWPYLLTYLNDGRYEIDNNRCERAIKPFVMGRKAWLFANSEHGAHASARLFTLIETAKANGVEPLSYLEYVFKELLNCTKVEDYEALLPWRVKSILSKFS